MKRIILVIAALACATAFAQWKYDSKKDAMTGSVESRATLNSANKLQLPFPYSGGSGGYLSVRPDMDTTPPGTDVMIGATKGQVLSHRDAEIKFDDEPLIQFALIGLEGGSSNGAFLRFPGYVHDCAPDSTATPPVVCEITSDLLVKKMKAAKKMKVQIVFYDYGPGVFEFKPQGLKWAVAQ